MQGGRAVVLAPVLALVLAGCGGQRRERREGPKKYIPTPQEIAAWVKRCRHTDYNMVTVPAGRYKVGDNSFKGNPERYVKIERPFKIDKFEVTNHDWFMYLWATKDLDDPQFMAAPPTIRGDFATDGWVEGDPDFQYDWQHRAKHPVRAIGYYEAVGYAKFLRKRLPTAVEWEVAARGPQGYRYPWGNRYTLKDWKTKAWTSFMMSLETTGKADRSTIRWLNDTVPVDSLPAGKSPFGCYHMAGNVSEWTTSRVPTGRGEWRRRPKRERPLAQVVKGGSFYSRQKGALAAQFFDLLPQTVTDQFRVGFRCVRD